MSDDTHRLVGDNHYHDGERLRTGDMFAPTERELDAFGFKFEPLEDTETETDESDDSEGDDVDVSAIDSSAVDLEAMEYSRLQELAKEHGIAANQSTDDLIAAIREAKE